MRIRTLSMVGVALLALGAAGCKKVEPPGKVGGDGSTTGKAAGNPGGGTKFANAETLYATFKTNKGDIVVRLFPKDAPKTVQNFVGLATGEREWRDPKTNEMKRAPYYDGTIFHRVIPNFMIQGGDPLGMGYGGPGYKFEDEFQSGRTFDKPGLLAMANSGPNTNGSQFFITTSTPQHLNNRHTIFGEVVRGYDVVQAIENVPRDPRDKPLERVVIEQLVISEKEPK